MMDLQARMFVPIAQVGPSIESADALIRGVVTLVWPYSSFTQSLTVLLVEPDFRLRRNKGQVRITFKKSSARAVAKSGLRSGDELILRLLGVEWSKDDGTIETPGRGVEWSMRFSERLALQIERESQEPILLDIDHPILSPVTQPLSPTPPESPPFNALHYDPKRPSDHLIGSRAWQSPAFLKRKRSAIDLSSHFIPDSFLYEDDYEESLGRKRSKFGRTSGQWRFSDGTPSPIRSIGLVKSIATGPGSLAEAAEALGKSESPPNIERASSLRADANTEKAEGPLNQASRSNLVENVPSLDTTTAFTQNNNRKYEKLIEIEIQPDPRSRATNLMDTPADIAPSEEFQDSIGINGNAPLHTGHDLKDDEDTVIADSYTPSEQDTVRLNIDRTSVSPDILADSEPRSKLHTPDPPRLKPLSSPGLPLVSPLLNREDHTSMQSLIQSHDPMPIEASAIPRPIRDTHRSPSPSEQSPVVRFDINPIEEGKPDLETEIFEPLAIDPSIIPERNDELNKELRLGLDRQEEGRSLTDTFLYPVPFESTSDQYLRDDSIQRNHANDETIEFQEEFDKVYLSHPTSTEDTPRVLEQDWDDQEHFDVNYPNLEGLEFDPGKQVDDGSYSDESIELQEGQRTTAASRFSEQVEFKVSRGELLEDPDQALEKLDSMEIYDQKSMATLMDELFEGSEPSPSSSHSAGDNQSLLLSGTLLPPQVISLDELVSNHDSGDSDGSEVDLIDFEEVEGGCRTLEQDEEEADIGAESEKSTEETPSIMAEKFEGRLGHEPHANASMNYYGALLDEKIGLAVEYPSEETEVHPPNVTNSSIESVLPFESYPETRALDSVSDTSSKEADGLDEDETSILVKETIRPDNGERRIHSSAPSDSHDPNHETQEGPSNPALPVNEGTIGQSSLTDPKKDPLQRGLDPMLLNHLFTPANTQPTLGSAPSSPLPSFKVLETKHDLQTPQPTQSVLDSSLPPFTPINAKKASLIEKLKGLRTSSTEKQLPHGYSTRSKVKSPWFTPTRPDYSASETSSVDTSRVRNVDPKTASPIDHNQYKKETSSIPTTTLQSYVDADLHQPHATRSPVLETPLSYFPPLSALPSHFSNIIDVLVLALMATSPIRANSGPRDWYQTIYLIDPSTYQFKTSSLPRASLSPTSSFSSATTPFTTALLFRPFKAALPAISAPTAILLRNFKVVSSNRKPSLLSTESSAWAVFSPETAPTTSFSKSAQPVQVHGPPIEFGDEEATFSSNLSEWFHALSSRDETVALLSKSKELKDEAEKDARKKENSKIRKSSATATAKAIAQDGRKSGNLTKANEDASGRANGALEESDFHELRDGTIYTDSPPARNQESRSRRASEIQNQLHELRDGTVYSDDNNIPPSTYSRPTSSRSRKSPSGD